MVDERAALSSSGLPAAAAASSVGSMGPPPIQPPHAHRPPPISVVPPPTNGNGLADHASAVNGNGNINGVSRGVGSGGGGARTSTQDLSPQPSPRTKRFTPVRALHVATAGPNEGIPQRLGSPGSRSPTSFSPSFPSPRLGSGEANGVTAHAGPSSNAPPSPSPLGSPAHRRLSTIDRRVRSEAFSSVPKRHMTIGTSRRPSILTGGYESSTDEDKGSAQHKEGHERSSPGMGVGPLRGPALLNLPSSSHATSSGRRRAQSLVVTPHESWPSPGTSTSMGTSRRPSRLARPTGTGSPLRTPAGGATPTMALSRAASDAFSTSQVQRTGPQRSGSSGGRSREASGAEHNDREREDQQRRMEQRRNNPLAASLGLASSRPAILSPDQIEHLLADADFTSAVARMAKPKRRQSSVTSNEQPSLSSPPLRSSAFTSNNNLPSTNTTLSKPYLVTAPPALTNGDWQGRDRAPSVSSSIGASTAAGTPLRNVSGASHHGLPRRSRALSNATLDSDGGHIPFTHHVSPVICDSDIEEEPKPEQLDKELDPPQLDADRTATASPNGDEVAPRPGSPIPVSQMLEDETKDVKARRRISGLFGLRSKKRDLSPPPSATLPGATQPAPKRRINTEGSRDRPRDRDAEMRLAEKERREAEMAQELRYRSMMQIQAHPASQRRAQRAATHLDAYYSNIYQGLENPPKFNPLAVLRWVRRTDEQKEAKARWQREHGDAAHLASPLLWGGRSGPSSPGSEALRSPGSPRPSPGLLATRSAVSVASKEASIAPGWHYTLDDVQAYNESGGRVDFFIPPVLPESVEAEGRHSLSVRSDGLQSQPSLESGPDKMEKGPLAVETRIETSLASPSTPSLLVSGPGDDGGAGSLGGDLSRKGSVDTGHRPIRASTTPSRIHRHRSHQSTSGIPQSSKPMQTLRALGTGVKRNLAMAVHSPPTDNEDERRAMASTGAGPWHASSAADGPAHQISMHSLRDTRGRLRLRRHQPDGTGTSDDEHHHLRRLLGRGRPNLSRRVAPDVGGRRVSRAEELRNLESALARERTLREAQAKKAKRTELELQAEERLCEVEEEIYAEREIRLKEAQSRLSKAEVEQGHMDAAIAHYLAQLDQVRSVFRTAADVDIKFEGLDALSRPERRDTDDEEADLLSPLESDANFSDHRARPPKPRTRPPVRQGSTWGVPSLPSFAYGLQAWPRRSTVDPTLGVPLDPFRRFELACDKARTTVRNMDDERASATRQMQDMVATVNALIAQKDHVRAWAKAANERIAALKATKASKATKVHGGLMASMWHGPGIDMATDLFVRACLAIFSYAIRVGRVVSWVRGRGYLAWAFLGGVLAMLVVFYLAGNADVPMPPKPIVSL